MAAQTQAGRARRGNGAAERGARLNACAITGPVEATAQTASQDAMAAFSRRLNRLTQENAELRQRVCELEAALEKRTGRLQQVIGERDQLTSLLAGRDAEVQRLNREIGALTPRKAAPAPPSLLAATRTMLKRFQDARAARKSPARPKPATSSPPTGQARPGEAPLVPWVKDGPPKAVLAAVVLGLQVREIESVLNVIERDCAQHNLAPLLLTDNDAFQTFRGRRVVFEFFPPRAQWERAAPGLDWQLYLLRRLALIRRKWQPVRVVAFGPTAAQVVQTWAHSPFEEAPIPALLTGRTPQAGLPPGKAAEVLPGLQP